MEGRLKEEGEAGLSEKTGLYCSEATAQCPERLCKFLFHTDRSQILRKEEGLGDSCYVQIIRTGEPKVCTCEPKMPGGCLLEQHICSL